VRSSQGSWREETLRAHGFEILAERHVRFLGAGRITLPPAKCFIPAESTQLEVELEGECPGLFLVFGLEPDAAALIVVLDVESNPLRVFFWPNHLWTSVVSSETTPLRIRS
jgi:hypothetical protein